MQGRPGGDGEDFGVGGGEKGDDLSEEGPEGRRCGCRRGRGGTVEELSSDGFGAEDLVAEVQGDQGSFGLEDRV